MAVKSFVKSTQQSAPTFTKLLEDVSCLQGQEATLECCVQGYPIPDIRWEKGGIQLANSRRLHTERQGDKCRLHIKSCTRLETGVFKCIATNKFGTASSCSTVRFDVVPPKLASTTPVQAKTSSSPDTDKTTEFQKNISKLKKVSKPVDGKSNGLTERSSPSFKDFVLKKRGALDSVQSKTDTPPRSPQSLRKATLNGCLSSANKEQNTPKSNGTHTPKPSCKPEHDKPSFKVAEKEVKGTPPLKKKTFMGPTNTSKNDTKITRPVPTETPKTNGHFKSNKKENESQGLTAKSSTTTKSVLKSDKNGRNTGDAQKTSVRHRKQPPKFVLSPKSKVVKEGEPVKFICSSSGFPEPTVTWKKKDTELPTSDRVLCYQRDCMHILEITDVACEDAGDYSVILVNQVGRAEAPALLEVRAKKASRVAPRVIRPLGDQSVAEGVSCVLSCEVFGVPTPNCWWSKAEKTLDTHPDFKESFDGQTACLTISEVFLDDEGIYTLTAQNEVGQINTSCSLTVMKHLVRKADDNSRVPVFTRKLNDTEVNDGDPLTLTVEVSGTEPMEIIWVHNESVIKNSADFRYISSEDKKCHSLVIEETYPEDSGIYFCEAYNLYGEDVTACMVTIKVPANNMDTTLEEKNATQSLSAEPRAITSEMEKLMSSTKRKSDAEVQDAINTFRRNVVKSKGTQENEERQRPNHRVGGTVLPPNRIMEEEVDGQDTKSSQDSCEDRTTQRQSPRLSAAQILKGPRSFAVLRGETITLRCQYIGSPKPTVTWVKGGKILTSNERVSLEEEESQAVLTVKGAMTDDSGKYVIVVENSGGSDCQFSSVSVEGPPDPLAERPVVTDVTNHSLVLAWSGSPFDGGSVITGYAVEMCSHPELRWQRVSVARHSTSYVVKNLLPNRSYIFRVRAENVHGFSDPSPESEPVFIREHEVETSDDREVFEDRNVVIQNGTLFLEKYEFLEVVGKGRFGVVHRCRNKTTDEIRAAKVIRCVKQKDKQKMREEVNIMNLLRHPKLLQLVSAFENPKDLILVMEYISGGELFERVIADDFVLLEKDCVLFLHQICEAVRYMHENNVIHLDLKPENILCVTKTSHQIKIIDFGLARKFDPKEGIRVLFGTPEFVAPEVISYEPVSTASDMWSVGVICYVLLTGLSPFMGDNDAETFANITRVEYDFDDEAFDAVSADAKDFIDQLFKKRPEKRMSASASLRHTWLAKDQNRMSVVQLCTDKLKKFIIRRKWQKTGNAIRALGRMVSLSSPNRSISSLGSQSDSEVSFTMQTQSSLSCSPAITEKDEDTESGVFLSSDCASLGEVQG